MERAVQLAIGGSAGTFLPVAPFNNEDRLKRREVGGRTKRISQEAQPLIIVCDLYELVLAHLNILHWAQDKELVEACALDDVRRVGRDDHLGMLFGGEH